MEKATVRAYSILWFFFACESYQKWRRPFKLVCIYHKTETIFEILGFDCVVKDFVSGFRRQIVNPTIVICTAPFLTTPT